MAITPGTRLGPYEVISLLGAGGMGEVYRARDSRLGRDVAIKILPREMAADPDRLSRFEREARLASSLNHPNIVTIYDIGWSGQTPYIAMELVDGSTVRDLLRTGPLPIRQVLAITTQIAEGLAKAHEAGIVHRDLKPANVMITCDGLVKILDFGLGKHDVPFLQAASASEAVTAQTLTGTVTGRGILGTVDYMSPEQAAGRRADFRSDQFSLGSVACEMATGRCPFRRETVAQTLAAIIEDPPDLTARLAEPDRFGRIVHRCLEKDPEERYPSTRTLATELRDLTTRLSVAMTAATAVPARTSGLRGAGHIVAIVLLVLALGAGVPVLAAVAGRLGPVVEAPLELDADAALFGPTQSAVVPYWSLAVLNLVVLIALAATLLALDRRSIQVRVFAAVLLLRGIVGVTATFGDGAQAPIARAAIALDAATSTLLSGALAIFVLLYPRRRTWAGPGVLGTIAIVTLVFAGLALVVPSSLGVFRVAPNGTLAAVSVGPLLSERVWYWIATAVCSAVLALEHTRIARPELRRSVLLIGIALAVFPINLATTFIALPRDVSVTAVLAYGGEPLLGLAFFFGAVALVAMLMFAATELRCGDRRAAAGTLAAGAVAVATGVVGALYGAAPTVAGSLAFVLRGLWRFPLPILATYALLRHQLLGIDVHLKLTIRRGLLAAIFIVAFVTAARFVQNIGSPLLGYLAGAVAAGLLLFALGPLQRLAEGVADAALPRTRDPRTAPPARRLDAYRQAAELMLADGVLTTRKERALAALADELGIGAIDALEARQQALEKT